jgi:hypothetical protein
MEERYRRGGAALGILVCQQDAHILDRSDQVILDLLSPEPSPARSLEVVIVGGISKTTFH